MNDGVVDRAEHSAQLEEEMYHQHQAERLIAKMKDRQKAAVATGKEAERRRKFENKHVGCAHCIDGQGGSISGARGVDLHGGRTT